MDLYGQTMKLAVQLKRIANGTYGQTGFTRYLEEIQYKSSEELKAIQAVFLSDLLNHAVENIPYYKYLQGQLELSPSTVFDDIKHFPVINKNTLLEHGAELMADNVKVVKTLKTSGSTGPQASICSGKYPDSHGIDEFLNNMIGVEPGMSRFVIMSIYSNKKNGPDGIEYKINRISKTYKFGYGYFNEKRYKFIIDYWMKKKPKIIWGIIQPIYSIARYMEINGIEVPSPEIVLVGGQTLLPQYRETIERVWKTKMYDRYGSIECGVISGQCLEQESHHYSPTNHFIEIVDKNENYVKSEEKGLAYITTLSKRAMPMIRYNHDDMVVHTDKTCPCGCNFPILKQVLGKRREGIISPSGAYLDNLAGNDIIIKEGYIKDFQIIQREDDEILIRYIEEKKVGENIKNRIAADLNNVLDNMKNIEFEKVNELKPLPNGKMLRIIPIALYKGLDKINSDTI